MCKYGEIKIKMERYKGIYQLGGQVQKLNNQEKYSKPIMDDLKQHIWGLL